MAITKEELEKLSKGTTVKLSGFYYDNEEVEVVLKRPSIFKLIQDGEIPNELLKVAGELFDNGINVSTKTEKGMDYTAQILIQIAKASLISPTYQEIIDSGLNLTDLQLLQIYNFTQQGVRSLKSFR